ncbi:hypothetical protein BS329_15285 [Amycolatopsis coloradensis]|uniref:DUF4238 domain-containing protein n=1 Tax=Amycolatopsis coloradensis TaxID=76021 RepID=A0A1R0KU39_9PSEU|nr:DUF4238 domain-containing protein [Amycolatopsis coloradensis]OLZ51628.1 hypothetical protein BS329_15285 [Amycolatopsis coloradensis]
MTEQKRKRAHHTVPRSHLTRFGQHPHAGRAHPHLVRVELPGTKRHLISVASATVEKDFYLTHTADGDPSDAFEDQLAEVEGAAATAVRRLVDDQEPLTDDSRERIAAWAALQHLRTPGQRDLLAVTAELTGEITGRGIREDLDDFPGSGPHTYVRHRELSRQDRDQLRATHLQSMVDSFRASVDTLLRRTWTVVFFRRKTLITSDSPVTLIPIPGADVRTPLSLTSNNGVLVPLDRRASLLMEETAGRDRVIAGTTSVNRRLNQEIANGARRCVFHHPDDDPLEGLVLPQPAEPRVMFERVR